VTAQELQSLHKNYKALRGALTFEPNVCGVQDVLNVTGADTWSYLRPTIDGPGALERHPARVVLRGGGGLVWPPSRLRSGSYGELLVASGSGTTPGHVGA
jgi:hypothetical protein